VTHSIGQYLMLANRLNLVNIKVNKIYLYNLLKLVVLFLDS